MSYINKTVSLYGTEKDFIKGFVNELTAADSRITCETDIDAEFEGTSTGHKPTIVFNINNCYKLNFVRQYSTGNTTALYNISQTINGTVTNNTTMFFSNSTSSVDYLAVRSWKFAVISNDNAIAIIFGAYNLSSFPSSYSYNVFSYHEQDFNAASLIANEQVGAKSALEATILRTDEGKEGESYTISKRLPYLRSNDNVEIIESKVLLKNGVAEYDMNNVFDCSTINKNCVAIVDNQRCYALDEHTLIPIKE